MMPSQFNRQQRYTCPFSMALLMILSQGLVTASSASQSCLNGPTLFVVIRQRKFPKQQIQSGTLQSDKSKLILSICLQLISDVQNKFNGKYYHKRSLKSVANMALAGFRARIFFISGFSPGIQRIFALTILNWWPLATYFCLNMVADVFGALMPGQDVDLSMSWVSK